MKIAFFGTQKYDMECFNAVNSEYSDLKFTFFDVLLDESTAQLAAGHDALCIFVSDICNEPVLQKLSSLGVKYIALRCAGYGNNVNLKAAAQVGIKVIHASYSPEAVAEFTVGLILTVVRKYHKIYNRVREGNFLLNGLTGFNLAGKTVGIVGAGKVGLLTGKILSKGFGCTVIAYDPYPNDVAKDYGISYVDLGELLTRSDIISLHCHLTKDTDRMINEKTLSQTKKGVILINTARGGLIDTDALIQALKTNHVSGVGLDVCDGESSYFFADCSGKFMTDDGFARLLSSYNVFMAGHQAFLTTEALEEIANVTLQRLRKLRDE